MHQHRCKPFPPRASLHDGIQNRRGGGTGRGCRPGPATIPAPAPRVSLGGRESLSPCVPTPQPGSHILIHSVYSLNIHTHAHAHTHTHTHRSFMFARARRRRGRRITGEGTKKPKSRHCPPSPPQTLQRRGKGACFGGQEDDATTPHTPHATIPIIHVNEPLSTPRMCRRESSRRHSRQHRVCRAHAHIPTHTQLGNVLPKNKKAKRVGFFPPTPPTRVSSHRERREGGNGTHEER